MHRAVERNEFFLSYQPVFRIADGARVAVEALVRWRHPEAGVVAPEKFISIAEETGLIIPIGDWVLREACTQLRRAFDNGAKPCRLNVNLSARQFGDSDLVNTISSVLEETDFPADCLAVELTEGSLIEDTQRTEDTLSALKAMGLQVAIDDFGTGYSSVAYLKRFPLDCLKIDRSFISNVTSSDNDAAIVRAIIALGHSLQLRVLAEGVERDEQLEFLRDAGCDHAQGYLLGRPESAEVVFPELRSAAANLRLAS